MKLKRKYIVFIVIAIIFLGLFCRYGRRAPKRNYCDFRVYYVTAERFIQKQGIYGRPDEAITPFKYSPMFAFVLSPLSFFPQKCASFIFFTINFLSLIGIFVFSQKLIVKDKITFRQNVFLYIFTLICGSRFIFQVLDSGQVGIIITFLVILGLYYLEKKKEVLSSAFIALSTMFKYTSFIFLPYFFFRKKKKLVSFILLFIIIFCLLPAVYLGISAHSNYLKNWFPSITESSLDKSSWYDYKNQSLFSLTLRYFTVDSPYRGATASLSFNQGLILAFSICLLIYLLIILPGRKRQFGNSLDYSSLFICMALFNPNAWMHNFVVLIFAYMTLFYYLFRVKCKDKITLTLVIFSFMLMSLTGESIVGNTLENLFEELSSVTLGSLLLLVSLLRLKFRGKKGSESFS